MRISLRLLAPLALFLVALLAVAAGLPDWSGAMVSTGMSALAGVLGLAAVALLSRRQAPAYARAPRRDSRRRMAARSRGSW